MGALVFNIFLVVVFGGAVIETFGWRQEVSMFPRVVASLGLLMVTGQLVIELRNRRRVAHPAAGASSAEGEADAPVRIGRQGAAWLFAGLFCIVLLGVPVGHGEQNLALPLGWTAEVDGDAGEVRVVYV